MFIAQLAENSLFTPEVNLVPKSSGFSDKWKTRITTLSRHLTKCWAIVRDRPFNLKGGFCFVQNFFFGQHESLNIYFFCRTKRDFFSQNSTLGYMTKTLNQIFFFLHQNLNIFFSNIGNQNIFLEKKHTPPPPSS